MKYNLRLLFTRLIGGGLILGPTSSLLYVKIWVWLGSKYVRNWYTKKGYLTNHTDPYVSIKGRHSLVIHNTKLQNDNSAV